MNQDKEPIAIRIMKENSLKEMTEMAHKIIEDNKELFKRLSKL